MLEIDLETSFLTETRLHTTGPNRDSLTFCSSLVIVLERTGTIYNEINNHLCTNSQFLFFLSER